MSRRLQLLWAGLNLAVLAFGALETWTDTYCWSGGSCADELAAPLRRIGWGGATRRLLLVNSAWLVAYGLRERRYAVSAGCTAVLALAYWPLGAWLRQQLAPDYYTVLRGEQVGEGYRGETIAQAGLAIGPYLLQSGRDAQAPERRLALAGLGKLDYQAAVPLLDSIARNAQEPVFIRADALQALGRISSPAARRAVQQFESGAAHDLSAREALSTVRYWEKYDDE